MYSFFAIDANKLGTSPYCHFLISPVGNPRRVDRGSIFHRRTGPRGQATGIRDRGSPKLIEKLPNKPVKSDIRQITKDLLERQL